MPSFPRDACCGEIPFRFGDFDTFKDIVGRTRTYLEAIDTERLVCYCGSCSNFFGNIWPDFLGIKLPFEVISIWDWLWEKYKDGELHIERTLDKPVVLNDACYGSMLGDGFFSAVRGLHEAAGMTVVELPNNRFEALCCGFGATLKNNYDQSQIAAVAQKRVDQIVKTQVTDVSCYCPGCCLDPQLRQGEQSQHALRLEPNPVGLWR